MAEIQDVTDDSFEREVFEGGTVRGQLVGARSKSDFAELVDRAS